MVIGIDARGLNGKKTGIPIYIEKIIKEISELNDTENKYILYSNKSIDIDEEIKKKMIIKENNGGLRKFIYLFQIT